MAYKNFTFEDIEKKFNVVQVTDTLFEDKVIEKIIASDRIKVQIKNAFRTALTTEKAISERLVSPILMELQLINEGLIEIFSGENLIGDKKLGLNGECDFLMTHAPGSKYLKAPIFNVTEAKKGDIDNPAALAQNAAQLIGVRYFNERKEYPIHTIYGSCTSGLEWLFLKLEDNKLTIDTRRYSINQIDELLSILNYIANQK